jgi:predicted TIM-barrel fold metal-dependent hydrolase
MANRILVDWHTNLWIDEHLTREHLDAMHARSGGRSTDAGPERHRKTVADVADQFVIVTMHWPRLGVDVPNDYTAQYVQQFPGRAVGMACVDPMNPNAAKELERCVTQLGFKGLKLAPTYQGFDPLAKEAWAIYEIADHYKLPILWHQAGAFPAQSMLEYANPVLLDPVARRFPELKMILAHFGLPWAEEAVQLMRKHKQIYVDVSARLYRPWGMYNALLHAIDYGVTNQILFGSDFPVQTTQEAIDTFLGYEKLYPGLPPISRELIEDIIYNRPLTLFWKDLA